MGAVADVLAQMRAQRDALLQDLADVPEMTMAKVGEWGQRQMPIRNMYYLLINHEVEHTVQVIKTLQMLDLSPPEARQILGVLQEARGRLEGLVAPLHDEDIGKAPGGEWSIRQTLEHVMSVEDSFTRRIKSAVAAAE